MNDLFGPLVPLKLDLFPATFKQSNQMVRLFHRHHKPVVGFRFSIGCKDQFGIIRGIAIVGRPVGRKTNQYHVAEVTRLVTDDTKNVCSKLYSACARACKNMGYSKIQTFILESETGISLKAAGWKFDGWSKGGNGWLNRPGRRNDQPKEPKQRWIKELT